MARGVSIEHVTFGYGATPVLEDVSLEVEKGEFFAFLGPSGSGKTTLLRLIAGFGTPTAGRILIGDRDVTLLRREHIGFVFQFFNLLPMLSAEENILLPLSIAGEKPEKAFFDELMKRVGLDDRRHHRPSELSGGQQQRVAIARALVSRPTVVFADEPTGNLDSKTGQEILELLRASAAEYGQTMVMVTHDAGAATIADRIFFLADGLIVDQLDRSEQSEILAAMSRITQ